MQHLPDVSVRKLNHHFNKSLQMKEIEMNNQIYVWDRMVRFFHWTLVLAFIIAYLSGDELELVHAYTGYYILGLIAVRVVWGFIGTRYARFSQFLYPPSAAITYLKNLFSKQTDKKPKEHYIGHNPAGSWMVIALLLSILATGFSGLKLYELEGKGPLATTVTEYSQLQQIAHDDENEQDEDLWEDIHEFFANFTVLLIFLHFGGVILSGRKHHQNLVKSMITGYKTKNTQ